MKDKLIRLVERLTTEGKTISTMESCTGGGVANAITNVKGASAVINFSAVTYSNDFKIKMGVPEKVIDKYTVYSMETARAMAKAISDFSLSDYGIGITGKLGTVDPNNLTGDDNKVFICIYDREKDIYIDLDMYVNSADRKDDKREVIEFLVSNLVKYV